MPDPIQIKGLTEFNKALRRIDSDAPKALRLVFNDAADEVVTTTRNAMPSKTGKAKKSVKAKSTRTAARISEGGPKVPYVPWLDFGGAVGPRRSVRRDFLKEGRYLYQSYYKLAPKLETKLANGLGLLVEQSGLGLD